MSLVEEEAVRKNSPVTTNRSEHGRQSYLQVTIAMLRSKVRQRGALAGIFENDFDIRAARKVPVFKRRQVLKMRSQALNAANALLRYAGVQLVRAPSRKPWDDIFARWITEAKTSGIDPNDVGDGDWNGNAFDGASRHLFPRITPQSVVLELGPGTGRYTRHVLPRCHEMILVDYSELVCNWLREYLKGRGRFHVHHIDKPAFPLVPDASVDFAFANGVFEHIDQDDTDFFLQEFHRVLKPGGALWFNFDNIMSPGGLTWFKNETVPPGGRRVFRFYHPELLIRLAQMRGFEDVTVKTDERRLASFDARRPRQ